MTQASFANRHSTHFSQSTNDEHEHTGISCRFIIGSTQTQRIDFSTADSMRFNWQDLLKVDGLDVVVVAITNDQHHTVAVEALNTGLYVLCEKPLRLTIAECDKIIAAARKGER